MTDAASDRAVHVGVGVPDGSLAVLADRQAVLDVLHHYCYCVDHRLPNGIADEVFSPDAVDDHGFDRWEGREQLRAAFTSIVERFTATAHLLANPRILIDGDRATSHCHVTAWHWLPGGASHEADFVMVGTYEDELRRLDEGWRITFRRFRRVGPTPTASGQLPDFLRRYRPDES